MAADSRCIAKPAGEKKHPLSTPELEERGYVSLSYTLNAVADDLARTSWRRAWGGESPSPIFTGGEGDFDFFLLGGEDERDRA